MRKAQKIGVSSLCVLTPITTLYPCSVFAIFTLLKFHYGLSLLFGTICGVLFNFNTTGRIVFNSKDGSLIFRFFLVYGITYGINYAGLWLFERIHVGPLMAGAILILPVAVIAYYLNKYLVFSKS